MNKSILFIANFNDVYAFFERFFKTLHKLDLTPIVLTNKYSIYRRAQSLGIRVYSIEKTSEIFSGKLPVYLESLTDSISEKETRMLYNSVQKQMAQIREEHNPGFVIMWSGIRLIERAAANYANENGIKTLFMELGNFPGKIFADPKGTNAGSFLAENRDVLTGAQSDTAAFNKWRDDYISDSLQKHSVPQSRNAGSIDKRKNLLDLFGFTAKGFAQFEPVLSFSKLKNKWLKRHASFNYDEVDLASCEYIFYPMQVSDDAQILINSNTNNFGALEFCAKKANRLGLKLLVKPHPAERNVNYILKFQQMQNELGFYFVNGNTIELISKSEEVITINSTVGLQAKLIGKPTTCLGKAFFAEFERDELIAYFQNYLINADFWGSEILEVDIIKKFIQRAELE